MLENKSTMDSRIERSLDKTRFGLNIKQYVMPRLRSRVPQALMAMNDDGNERTTICNEENSED
jgi:hypothetical protein